MDRTVKILLAAIVILLTVIAFRTSLPLGSNAMAQSVLPVQGATSMSDAGIIVSQPSKITVPTGNYVREMQILNNANSFLVRYDDRIEVYHVQVVQLNKTTGQIN